MNTVKELTKFIVRNVCPIEYSEEEHYFIYGFQKGLKFAPLYGCNFDPSRPRLLDNFDFRFLRGKDYAYGFTKRK